MVEPVELDPGPYQGTYKLIGGALALDFANLVSYRGTDRQHDWLHPPANLGRWAEVVGIPVRNSAAGEARELREVLARVFLAVADGAIPASSDVTRIGALAAAAQARRRLVFGEAETAASWIEETPALLDEIARDAAALLTSAEALRTITACKECRWLFLDTTRNHSRRWCDPADCANRARQRRHYRRHTTGVQ